MESYQSRWNRWVGRVLRSGAVVGLGCLLMVSASRLDAALSTQGVVSVAWDANTEVDLVGYRVHLGTVSGRYTKTVDVGNVTDAQITGLMPETIYFVMVTAYNTRQLESLPSEQIAVMPRYAEPPLALQSLQEFPQGVSAWQDGPPKIVNREPLTTGGFAFTIICSPGQSLNIFASEDMFTWRQLGSSANPTGILRAVDALAADAPARYYQIVPGSP